MKIRISKNWRREYIAAVIDGPWLNEEAPLGVGVTEQKAIEDVEGLLREIEEEINSFLKEEKHIVVRDILKELE